MIICNISLYFIVERYDYDGEKPVDQASRLLDKMIDLKHQVGRVVDTTHDPQYKNGPYPLDAYLKTPVSEILEQQTLHVNAPVFNNYGDVKKVLNTVNKKISQLESNLKHVTRIRQEDEITCLAKVLSQEGDDIQRSKITSMVDKYIRSQKKVIEGKVQAELLNAKLQKQKANVEQNNKDVGKKTTVRRVPPTVPRVPPTVPRKRERTTAVNGKENQIASYKPWEKNVLPGSKVRVPPQPGTRTTTQTSNIQTRIQKQYSTHARRSSPPRSVSPSSHVIPMAVPLCNPRFLQGRTQAGVLSCEPLASSSPSTRTMMSPVANMSVVGENTMSEFNQRVLSPAMSQVSADTYDSFQQDIDQFGTGIALPGYQREKIQRPKSPPSKIASKPPILESYSQNPSSDVIATDMHRQNVLENKAFEWLQNELMGIVMSKVSTDQSMRREASLCEDHQYKYTNLNIEQEGEIQDETEEDSQLSDKSEVSSKSHQDDDNDELRKIFIDAGQPINQQLISTLVREALRERVTSFLGQANDNRPIVDQIDRKTGIEDTEVNKDEYDDDFESDSPELSVKQIPTPDLTPMSSLSDSPVQRRSPSPEVVKQPEIKKDILVTKVPEAADDSALYNSFLPAEPVRQPYHESSESEQSESYDISQELRRLAFKPGDERDGLLASLHNIETPSITPPIYSPSPPALHTLPNFTASPPPFDTLLERSPAATMTDRDDLDRTQPSLGATGTSVQFNKTQTSIDDYSNKDIKTRTKTIKVQSRSIDESLEETKKFPEHPPQPERSIKSPTRTMESSLSPVASPEPKTSSSLTDTINECISEGQWLLNRSEGQIADMPLDPGLLPMSNFNQIDISTASTLKDTDELDLDDNELLKSEGEFLHYSSVPVERDIARILDIQEQSYRQNVMNLPNTHIINTYPNQDEERHTDMSIGQVSNSRIIRVGQDPPRPSIGIIKPSKESPRKVQNYPQEFDDTPDSTMNLEELDFSKRNQQWKAPIKVKPRSSTFSMSDASLRNSHLEQSTSDAEYNQYRVRLSADSDGSVYSYEDDIDLNTAENSIPYRMSVTVPTVDPIIEDDDSDDISELHQTN
ncbi:hypothetical protein SNE40_009334 [Patella caerulea]|uniref:Uncharacterized protein n=1 Tax=Patella caerulea TaxID=87958 RepID=A0AAN8JSD3_PATCE